MNTNTIAITDFGGIERNRNGKIRISAKSKSNSAVKLLVISLAAFISAVSHFLPRGFIYCIRNDIGFFLFSSLCKEYFQSSCG